MCNTYFHFRHRFLLLACYSQSHATSCSSLMSHHQVNNKCNRVKEQHWRWLINFSLHNNKCFQKQSPLFLKVSQIPQENTCVRVFYVLESHLWKRQKNIHFTTNIVIYIYIYRSQTFWCFMKFYFAHNVKACFVFKKQLLCLYSSVYA